MAKPVFVQMTPEKLAELSKDRNNHVMECVTRPPLKKCVPLDEVEASVKKLWDRVRELRAAKPNPTPQDSSDMYQQVAKEFKTFKYTHPTFYTQIMNPKATQENIDTMLYIIQVRREGSFGGEEKIKERLKAQFVHSREEWEAKHGRADATHVVDKDATRVEEVLD
jgi:hypothetical protein